MSKHTPGPWVAQGEIQLVGDPFARGGQHALYVGRIRSIQHDSICTIQSADHCSDTMTREVAAANALLIAAAPELLQVLIECLECEFSVTEKSVIEKARAVIAKATGEQA